MAGPIVTEADAGAPEITGGPFGKKGIAWAIFEFARNPYYNIIVISIFAPYFGAYVVGGAELPVGNEQWTCAAPGLGDEDDPGARGQALVARSITIAGIIMALIAPVLGGMVDQGGRRKPILFGILAALALTTSLLWFVQPGVQWAIPAGMALMATGYVMYAISELLHNAMLPTAGRTSALPLISGLGIALGNTAGILLLVLIGVLLTGSEVPAFGLEKASFEHLRITGPIAAIWLAIFIVPFFAFMPDIEVGEGRGWRAAATEMFSGKGGPVGLVRSAASYVASLFKLNPNVMRFLVGRMIYADGIAALLTLGSVYVGTFLCWSPTKLIAFNLVAGVCAVIGAYTAGFIDQRLGPKKSIIIELSLIICLLTVQLSVTRESLLFGLIPSGHVVWEGGLFSTLTDVFYLILIMPIALMLGACISSSRYMLVHIAPPKQIGQFFGFYAMAGSVTVWLGPGLVDIMTTLSGDQRIGMSGLGLLFIAGLFIITGVKADKTPEHLKSGQ